MLPKRLGETNIYNRAYINYVHLRGKDLLNQRYDIDKFDGYYGIRMPVSHGDWLYISPVAGIRITEYLKHQSNKNYTRTIAQLGFDVSMLFSGKSNYVNETWNIHGIKHIIQPIIHYRYIPQARIKDKRVPLIETRTFDTNLSIIDLADMRKVDDISSQNMFRIGVKNSLQTSTGGYCARNLLKFDVYQDIRLRHNVDALLNTKEKTLSDTYILIGLYPVHWFGFDCYSRIDPKRQTLNEITTATSIHNGDVWKLSFLTHTLQRDTNQYGVQFMAKLNSRVQFGMAMYYDARIKKFTEQRFSIYSTLGRSWNVEYLLLVRGRAARESKYQFATKLDLIEF
jgi:LPS-assembly protein